MGLKMKNVNIMGFHQFLGEGGHKKQYIYIYIYIYIYEELPKKGSVAKNRKGVFEGGLIPRCTLWLNSGT